MTDQTPEHQRRAAVRALVAATRTTPWTQDDADAYHQHLADLHPDDVAEACRLLAVTAVTMPTVAEIRGQAAPLSAARSRDEHDRAAAARQAAEGRAHLIPASRPVANRLCGRCSGDLVLLTQDRQLWCQACSTVQVIETTPEGKTRITLTAAELDDLVLHAVGVTR